MTADLDQAARAIEAFLRALGHDPAGNPELARTGGLVADAYANDLLAGYAMDPAQILAESVTGAGGDLVVGQFFQGVFQVLYGLGVISLTVLYPAHAVDDCGVVGAQFGVRYGERLRSDWMRLCLAGLILLICARLAVDLVFAPTDPFNLVVEGIE